MNYGCAKCGSERVYSTAIVTGLANVWLGKNDVTVDELGHVDFEVKSDSMRYGTCQDCNANFKLPRLEVTL